MTFGNPIPTSRERKLPSLKMKELLVLDLIRVVNFGVKISIEYLSNFEDLSKAIIER